MIINKNNTSFKMDVWREDGVDNAIDYSIYMDKFHINFTYLDDVYDVEMEDKFNVIINVNGKIHKLVNNDHCQWDINHHKLISKLGQFLEYYYDIDFKCEFHFGDGDVEYLPQSIRYNDTIYPNYIGFTFIVK